MSDTETWLHGLNVCQPGVTLVVELAVEYVVIIDGLLLALVMSVTMFVKYNVL